MVAANVEHVGTRQPGRSILGLCSRLSCSDAVVGILSSHCRRRHRPGRRSVARRAAKDHAAPLSVASLAVLALTLYPDGSHSPTITCNVGLPYLAPPAVESTANILVFVPISFLAGALWRGPVMVALGAGALSASIELVEALVLVIGRACDTSDWITNVIGGVLAAGALTWERHRK